MNSYKENNEHALGSHDAGMVDERITQVKKFRVEIDTLTERLRLFKGNAEETLAFRALQEAKHWLGESLPILRAQNAYPHSMDPSNTTVDPTADRMAASESGCCKNF